MDTTLSILYQGNDPQVLEHLHELRDEVAKEIAVKRFKQYYEVEVAVKGQLPQNLKETFLVFGECTGKTTNHWMVMVDMHFEEAIVARDASERTRFFLSLGPEWDAASNAQSWFVRKVLEADEK